MSQFPVPPPLFSPTFAHPPGVLLKEGLLSKATLAGNRPVYVRLTVHPLSILEYDSEASASPSAVHHPDVSWSFGHNPTNHSILLKTPLFNVVLVCSSSAEHREWRHALLRVQEEINAEEEEKEREIERQRQTTAEEEAQRELEAKKAAIQERKLRKLQSKGKLKSDEPLAIVSTSLPSSSALLASTQQSPTSSEQLPALSPSARASSDVTVATPLARSQARGTEEVKKHEGEEDGEEEEGEKDEEEVEDDEAERRAAQAADGSHTDSEASVPPQSSLYRRSSQQRSLSLDDLEMSALINARHSPASTGSGGEPRKLTDPTPGGGPTSVPLSPQPGKRRLMEEAKESEEEERARRAEEKHAQALRAQKTKAYAKLFGLSEEEELICDYSCAVQRSILLHGRMYISVDHLCFFSSIFSHKTTIVISMDDVLHVQAARVALVFDNALRVAVQTGPLPVPVKVIDDPPDDLPVPAHAASSTSWRERTRRFSNSSRKSEKSDGHSPQPDDDVEGEEGAGGEASTAGSAAQPLVHFTLTTATTLTASFTLSQEQINYLISIQHPNITQHFFASFLTRDHALTLLEGLLKRKHGRDGFTSLSSTLPTPVTSVTTSPALTTRSLAKGDQAQGAGGGAAGAGSAATAEKERSKWKMPVAQSATASSWMAYAQSSLAHLHSVTQGQSTPSASTISTAASTPTIPSSAVDDQHSMLLPASASQELPTSLSFSSPPQSPAPPPSLPSSVSSPSASSLAHPPPPFLPPPAPAGSAAEQAEDEEEATNTLAASIDFGGGDFHPPLGDHRDDEDSPLLDTTFPLSLLHFFHLFFADHAPFGLQAFHAGRANDSEFRVTAWRAVGQEEGGGSGGGGVEDPKRREAEGDLIRHIHYRMQFVTPVGPPVTRVHRIQRWYVQDRKAQAEGRVLARLDSCSVTPDIMFGDVVLILERMYVEQVSEGGEGVPACVRVRVMGGVRFRSRPWKMKPFMGLIQQRSRDDSKKGAEDWEAYARRRMAEEPDRVGRAALKAQRLRGKKGLQQLIGSSQPSSSAAASAVAQAKEQLQQPTTSHASTSSVSAPPPSSHLSLPPPAVSAPSGGAAPTAVAGSSSLRSSSAFSSSPSSLPSAPSASPWPLLSAPALQALWAESEWWHRAAVVTTSVAVLLLLVFGAGSSVFLLSCLCSLLLLHWGVLQRLQRLQSAVDVNRSEVQAVTQLLLAMRSDTEKTQAEERENRKRKVSNVVVDPDHFPKPK